MSIQIQKKRRNKNKNQQSRWCAVTGTRLQGAVIHQLRNDSKTSAFRWTSLKFGPVVTKKKKLYIYIWFQIQICSVPINIIFWSWINLLFCPRSNAFTTFQLMDVKWQNPFLLQIKQKQTTNYFGPNGLLSNHWHASDNIKNKTKLKTN